MPALIDKFVGRAISRFTLLAVLPTLFLLANVKDTRAGDQDGITGYKFKIYDADGDGIDGNEVGASAGGTLAGNTAQPERVRTERTRTEAKVVALELRGLLLWWFR
jgi:hypothetical protein